MHSSSQVMALRPLSLFLSYCILLISFFQVSGISCSVNPASSQSSLSYHTPVYMQLRHCRKFSISPVLHLFHQYRHNMFLIIHILCHLIQLCKIISCVPESFSDNHHQKGQLFSLHPGQVRSGTEIFLPFHSISTEIPVASS